MLKRYNLAHNMLQNAHHSNDGNAKMDEYRETMQDFTLLRNDKGDEVDRAEVNNAAVVDVLPASQKGNAQKLMRLLREHGDDVVSWTQNGNVSIHGQRLRGTNIVDLVGDVVRLLPSKGIAPQRERFLTALADVNVPETLVKNKTALERYRKIKNIGATTMRGDEGDATVS